jgi:hypothetical protein
MASQVATLLRDNYQEREVSKTMFFYGDPDIRRQTLQTVFFAELSPVYTPVTMTNHVIVAVMFP